MIKDTLTAIRHKKLKRGLRHQVKKWNEKKGAHDTHYAVAGGKELDFKSLRIPKALYDYLGRE